MNIYHSGHRISSKGDSRALSLSLTLKRGLSVPVHSVVSKLPTQSMKFQTRRRLNIEAQVL
jgi:hypothetical protein